MEGKLADGTPIRWRYEKSTPTSFNYRAEKIRSSVPLIVISSTMVSLAFIGFLVSSFSAFGLFDVAL